MNRFLRNFLGGSAVLGTATAASLFAATPASACGGLFCSSANPVNQAAEQIIFADNGDGTVTAVIQILYEGPSNEFAWVLPVPGTPEVAVSSEQALQVVKQATNPLYTLQRTFGDSCQNVPFPMASSGLDNAAPDSNAGESPNVTVVDSGSVGPYVYETIMVDPSLDDRAQVAVDWLTTHEYDLGEIGADVLRPYLDENLNLIAFRLTKDSDAGSIRPIMLTYDSSVPSIPIRPTAVAANDDMGVLVFLLSDVRGIPKNYKALELNEALIDWFNPNNNYNEVVSRAADEAMGQGFVTEFAGPHANVLATVGVDIFPQWQRDAWNQFQAAEHPDPLQMIDEATSNWGSYDGFSETLRGAVTLPDGVAFSDFQNCSRCYVNEPGFVFDSTLFLRELYESVIKPMLDTQALFDAQPYLTRLYTTMSAEDMTMDPLFDFNPDLDDVSNIHTATQEIQCSGDIGPFSPDAPWTATLPQGDVVAGTGTGVWPIAIESQPAALRILQFGTSGDAEVVTDNGTLIAQMVEEDNEDPTTPMMRDDEPAESNAGSGSDDGNDDGKSPTPGDDDTKNEDGSNDTAAASDGGCNAGGARGLDLLSPMLLAGLGLLGRRRALRNTNVRREP